MMSKPMNPRELRGAALLMAAFFLLGLSSTVVAQDESVHPGINESFVERDLDRWIERFEGEDRDLYKRRTEVVAVLELEPGMAVADIGAGTGFFSMLFAREVGPAGKVYALDITPKFIDHIEKTAAELGLDNVESRLNPVDSTGLEENSVDIAFIADTYHHFEYPYKMLASIKRALRPGGRVVLVDLERIEGVTGEFVLNMVRAGKGTFTDEFKNAGFELIDEVAFTDEDYILRFKERE